MRVLVWNVHGFKAGAETVASAAASLEPDVALITECGTCRQLDRFSDGMKMRPVAAGLSPILPRIRNAVLVREPWRVERFRLQPLSGRHLLHPRGALVVGLRNGDVAVTVLCVHLGLAPRQRVRHARELVALGGGIEGPVVIGGDLNDFARSRSVRAIAEVFPDVWPEAGEGAGRTFPARRPAARIDYLFASEGIRVRGAVVPGNPLIRQASDHLPLVVELEPELREP